VLVKAFGKPFFTFTGHQWKPMRAPAEPLAPAYYAGRKPLALNKSRKVLRCQISTRRNSIYTYIGPNSTWLVSSHLNMTRHVRRVETSVSSRAVPTRRTTNKL